MAQPPPDLLTARHAQVRAALGREGLDALVVFHLPNIRYLTGFAGSTAIAVAGAGRDRTHHRRPVRDRGGNARRAGLSGAEAGQSRPDLRRHAGRAAEAGRRAARGFESAHLTVKRFDGLTAALRDTPSRRAAALVPAERLVEAVRVRKDAAELETFRRAGALIGAVARDVLGGVRAGQREWEVAADIDDRIRRGGFERPAFDTIVASGPNGALPHARPGDRRLQAGDLVVLDFGGVYDGYCVDITRTVSVGAPGAEARRVYDAVAEAQLAGVAGRQASAAGDRRRRGGPGGARGLRARATRSATRPGHGLGLEIHEEPRVGPRRSDIPGVPPAGRDDRLEPGVVFTIEPGAYLPGFGGVRIEDDVVVTEAGVEWLTRRASRTPGGVTR